MRRCSRVGMAILWVAVALSVSAATSADEGRYFPETGHALDTVFESFYDSHGGEAILGHPITESYVDPYSGFLVQYFVNARLELAPESLGDLEVRLTDLGVLLGGWELPLAADRLPIGTSPGCRYYRESGHQVCHAFLDFYEMYGGQSVFGYPITEVQVANDRMVQYFQDFRLDWYPESFGGNRIRVAPLGRSHFQLMGYPPSLLEPIKPDGAIDYPVLSLRTSSSVSQPLIGVDEVQQVYLVVSDQNLRPVEGAAALLAIHYPDRIDFRMMPLTDESGVTQLEIPLDGQLPGTRVALEYTIVFRQHSSLARDSFYVWY